MKPNILAILALLGLHGCNTVEDPFLDGMTGNMPVATGNRELPVHLASASLTGLGEMPIGLRQTFTDGVTRQTMVWANTTTLQGENALTISTSAASRSTLRKGPDRAEITRTLRREFPGVSMSVDPVIRRNAYGAFGAATGKLGDKGGCVYAWQIIGRDVELGRNEPREIRLRYCHQALGPEVLADLLTGLSVRDPGFVASTATVAYGYPAFAAASKQIIDHATIDQDADKSLKTGAVSVAATIDPDIKATIPVRIPKP